MKIELVAVTKKYEKVASSVKQRVRFVKQKMARLEAEFVKVTQVHYISAPKAKQLPLEIQFVCWLAKAKKLRECVSTLDTDARAQVLEVGKLPATMSKRKKALVVVKKEQTRVELDAWNAHVAKFEACAMELEKQQKQSASQMRFAEFKCSVYTMRLKRWSRVWLRLPLAIKRWNNAWLMHKRMRWDIWKYFIRWWRSSKITSWILFVVVLHRLFSGFKSYSCERLRQFLNPSKIPCKRHWSSFAGASLNVRRLL